MKLSIAFHLDIHDGLLFQQLCIQPCHQFRLMVHQHEVAEIKGDRERQGEIQYLTSFVGFDSSEDMWLSTAQLEHAPVLL